MPARADVLANSLYGFEIMVGPYAVAALRLTRMLQQNGSDLPGDGVQVMLTNTLESPHEKIPELPLLYQPIGLEHKRAKRVKDTVPILVCIGNPPYDRHAAVNDDNQAMTGAWVRHGESKNGKDAILEDFIAPVKAAGHGGDLKNLYNLYVYFWRWALWKTFEHDLAAGPGVVTYITASSFIDGDAFLGMRRHMRRLCDEIWIIDLGGEGRGTRQDDNVFAIKTPVAITVAVRYGSGERATPAKVHYTRVEGSRAEKLHRLEALESLDGLEFVACSDEWDATFRPSGQGDYFGWPLLTELMPWQSSGSQIKRTWPLGTEKDVLAARWRALLTTPDRALAFKETRDRTIGKAVSALENGDALPAIAGLPDEEPMPEIRHYGYRSFDRQFLIADNRLGDYLRPSLWQAASSRQVYFASLFSQALGRGAALTVSAEVPDMDFFRGSFGSKNILPLYRDAAAVQPNLHPKLLPLLVATLERQVDTEDIATYLYAVLAQPAFTSHFHDELETRELRVPLTADAVLFDRAVALGRELLFLHTYGERFADGQQWPTSMVKNLKPVPSGRMPESFVYDDNRQVLAVDGGEFGPVLPQVWEYEVSGLKVVQSWLGYRMRKRKGKKSSLLDDITPTEWNSSTVSELLRLLNLLTRTLALHPQQATLLADILAGPLLGSDRLGEVPAQWRYAPKANKQQHRMAL